MCVCERERWGGGAGSIEKEEDDIETPTTEDDIETPPQDFSVSMSRTHTHTQTHTNTHKHTLFASMSRAPLI